MPTFIKEYVDSCPRRGSVSYGYIWSYIYEALKPNSKLTNFWNTHLIEDIGVRNKRDIDPITRVLTVAHGLNYRSQIHTLNNLKTFNFPQEIRYRINKQNASKGYMNIYPYGSLAAQRDQVFIAQRLFPNLTVKVNGNANIIYKIPSDDFDPVYYGCPISHAMIAIRKPEKPGHVMTGFIHDGTPYLHDSVANISFKCNWLSAQELNRKLARGGYEYRPELSIACYIKSLKRPRGST
jgi:hypothetical protein